MAALIESYRSGEGYVYINPFSISHAKKFQKSEEKTIVTMLNGDEFVLDDTWIHFGYKFIKATEYTTK